MAYTKKGRKFGREKSQREELFRALARSLVLHERIMTTEARAKSLRPFIERIITKARKNDLSTRRLLLAKFKNDNVVVSKLLDKIAPKYAERAGGYTRIIKVESRPGSGRSVAVIEFV